MYGFDSYHVLIVIVGASLLLAHWLPRLAFRRPPAASSLLMLFGFLGVLWFPESFARLDPISSPELWETTAEIVVIVVLFSTGLRIDNMGNFRLWRPTLLLLAVTMPLTIAAVAVMSWAMAGMTVAGAVLLGAVLAPTDPVLAGDVQVGPPLEGREHPVRFSLTTEAGLNALLDLQVDGTSYLTIARDVQRDPVRGTVLHVDFQIVRRDEVISADVPVHLVGEPEELHRADGVVDHQLFTLTVHATPGRIPNVVEVDISDLDVGDTVRVGDLRLPEGVTTEVDPEAPIVVGQPPQVTAEDLVTEEEAAQAAALAAEESAPDAQAGAETAADVTEEGGAGGGEG